MHLDAFRVVMGVVVTTIRRNTVPGTKQFQQCCSLGATGDDRIDRSDHLNG